MQHLMLRAVSGPVCSAPFGRSGGAADTVLSAASPGHAHRGLGGGQAMLRPPAWTVCAVRALTNLLRVYMYCLK